MMVPMSELTAPTSTEHNSRTTTLSIFLVPPTCTTMYVLPICTKALRPQLLTPQQTEGSEVWKDRLQNLLDATIKVFFPNNIAYEVACEKIMTCTTDMLSFKGYVHRWMAITTQVAPFTYDQIMAVLKDSTQAAIDQCTGGSSGRQCGFQWHSGAFDNSVGAGQQMNVLGAVSSLLVDHTDGPVTNSTGGTSVGNNNAGASSDNFRGSTTPPTTGDKAGASILTILILATAAGTFGWMSTGV